MSDPVLHVFAGPNGSGKSTCFERVVEPITHIPFVNADIIAADRWPESAAAHGYAAAEIAAAQRERNFASRISFATETVFSHPSKIEMVERAQHCGYQVTLHIIVVPVELAIARVVSRVDNGGHSVPEAKIRARFDRLWRYLADAILLVDEARVYDNSSARVPFRLVATYRSGDAIGTADWPKWTPLALREAGRST